MSRSRLRLRHVGVQRTQGESTGNTGDRCSRTGCAPKMPISPFPLQCAPVSYRFTDAGCSFRAITATNMCESAFAWGAHLCASVRRDTSDKWRLHHPQAAAKLSTWGGGAAGTVLARAPARTHRRNAVVPSAAAGGARRADHANSYLRPDFADLDLMWTLSDQLHRPIAAQRRLSSPAVGRMSIISVPISCELCPDFAVI